MKVIKKRRSSDFDDKKEKKNKKQTKKKENNINKQFDHVCNSSNHHEKINELKYAWESQCLIKWLQMTMNDILHRVFVI